MTDTDERMLTAAKFAEQVRGELETDVDLHAHAGLVDDPDHRTALSFLQGVDGWSRSSLRSEVLQTVLTEEATQALLSGRHGQLSNYVGLTEAELTASEVRLLSQLSEALENNGAPAFVSAAGNPETGKTNTMWLLVELRSHLLDDYLVVSNAAGSLTDRRVTSMHDLLVTLIEERDRPKAVVIDEGSTHFDARTYSREVAQQFTPAAKRFAKIGVDVSGVICHTGKDLHPEAKRLTTLAFWKDSKTQAEFFGNWSADDDSPSGELFSGPVGDVEPTSVEYDPDDSAPWAWNLEPGLFEQDHDWPGYLELLRSRGPAEG